MDVEVVIAELKGQYPGKTILKLPEDKPTEIICEVEPTSEHPDYSVAVAVITDTKPHYNDETENYEVLKGKLTLTVGDKQIELSPGNKYVIKLGAVHSAKSDEAWVRVITRPGWTPSGHHLV